MIKICPAARPLRSWTSAAVWSVCLSMAIGVAADIYSALVNGTSLGEAIQYGVKFGSVVLAPIVAIVFAAGARKPRA